MKKWLIGPVVLAVLGSGALAFVLLRQHDSPTASSSSSTPQATSSPASSDFNKQQYSVTDSSSLWAIANKKRPLSKGYTPAKLVVPNVPLRLAPGEEQMKVSDVMAPALEALFAAAKKDGINLTLSSGYRSEALQIQFYNSYVARDGQEAADKYSARPGTSEHQTGLAADVIPANDKCHLEVCFADTPEGKWVAAHAHEHGFVIRYMKDKESVTTYQYEPWHLRYVGTDLANELYRTGLTMEEFFGYY
jgi:zinc D-Ala-D-Ala carboxypeptidase